MRGIGKEKYNRTINYYEVDDSDTPEETRLRWALKPVRNFRQVMPRCCFTCEYLKPGDGWYECLRPAEPGQQAVSFDAGDGKQYTSVCDLYKPEKD